MVRDWTSRGVARALGDATGAGVDEDEPERTADARGAERPSARSAYHHQVRAIAPEVLVGREVELADLASFCTGSESYLWLRAGPWAGKTALMSWFVLNPPPSVRVVSFFVTSRLAAGSDRDAFLDVVIEQLASMLDRPVAASLADATRASHLLGMLDEAAALCADRGQRLVLVVDGLDEDTGAGAHSIAALLPAKPAAGMRVIVTGRHDPPVPSDVPATHPLRARAVARELTPSPHAQDIRREAERELTRLLRGTAVEQDLLGLVTAAGGGLSGGDLAELTGRPPWEVEEALRAVAGRTFTRRPASGWSRAEVYELGHDELRSAAVRFLGDARLAGYRQRLHDWARGYQRDHWPAHTPGYLFRGYFRMLHAAGDRTRMTACALDSARHDRMLEVSGGDTAALAEIAAAQDAQAGTEDLRTMALLAVRRDSVVERNRHIPAGLPAVWALLGHPARALALARSLADPGMRVEALVALSDALGEEHDEEHDVIGEAAAVARGITLPAERQAALVSLATAAARAGNLEFGVALAGEVSDPRRHALTLAGVVEAGARAGDTRGAAAVADTISDSRGRFSAQRGVAKAAAAAGDVEFGVALARGVDPRRQADVLRDVAEAAARGGHVDGAEVVARGIPDAKQRMWTLGAIATTVARSGNLDAAAELAFDAAETAASAEATTSRTPVYASAANLWKGDLAAAEDFAHRIVFAYERVDALVEVAAAMARSGDLDQARNVVADAEAAARTVDRTDQRARTLVGVVKAAALAGDTEHARRLADDAWALARITGCGEWDRLVVSAELVAMGMQELLRTISDPPERDRVSVEAVEISIRDGHLDRAEALARAVTDPELRAGTITLLARAVVEAGDLDRARDLADTAETTARTLTLSRRWALALADTAGAVAQAGDLDRAGELADIAETFARATVEPRWRAQALAKAAEALARSGSPERAMDVIAEVEALTVAFEDPHDRQWVHATVAKALAHAGKTERALEVAHTITNRLNRAPVLYEIIAAVARAGDLGHARGLVMAITDTYDQLRAATKAARAAAQAEHAILLARDAEAIARTCGVDSWRATTLAAAATAAAHAGEARYAHQLVRDAAAAARTLPDDRREDRARSLAEAAQAAARAGDLDHAAALTHEAEAELRTSAEQSWALQETVTAAILTGDTEHADTLARDLPPRLQGRAYAQAARYAEPAHARRLLAQALRLTDWRESVDALAVVQPEVLTDIAGQLVADDTGR
jgi:hypothetical protein